MTGERTHEASELMLRFFDRTGLTSDRPQRRYLWTDAFAVCTCSALAEAAKEPRWRDLARELIAAVHRQLGRHRLDDTRAGWLSGLDEDGGAAHPTAGGLRIGKPLPERSAIDPFDAELEWERDGQYFHYLTKWIHALDCAARKDDDPELHRWARELADRAHRGFVRGERGERRMIWKMSIDLSRPLVPSMGQHDPLDGLITCLELEKTARDLGLDPTPDLSAAIDAYREMIDPAELATGDPLGLGGLFFDAARLVQIDPAHPLVVPILETAVRGSRLFARGPDLSAPAHARLAFRELGLAIGLAALPLVGHGEARGAAAKLAREAATELTPLARAIESFWREPEHQRSRTWVEHEDIDDVMLATCLVPSGFLAI